MRETDREIIQYFLYVNFRVLKNSFVILALKTMLIMLDDHKKTDRKSFAVFKKNANFMKTKCFLQHNN